ncbi:WD40 repeat-like protein [Basidiobolus meristosporus CBS 931.73]|uniref:WD40 repeat-like protein n=1 Tax=Basidiobolus meristosporus CBS 931.73 TaxID=1314790 RepID=A0A1Y1YB47_9FUNG|nr:WD40 repeat-like protein [Basidiobolus meristosporus CBS 931.73]|eukprot:ORX95229.1 WD40 repeat-like protein [Basidiobolus meristosporus CBS 931.73]
MTADLERPAKRSRTSSPTSISGIESDEDFTESISSVKSEEAEETPVNADTVPKVLTKDQQQEKIFKNLRLRRIVKENHGREINQVSFHLNAKNYTAPFGVDLNKTFDKRGAVERDDGDSSNILASVGDTQANIYDNEHCGDHLDIMSHFLLSEDRNGKATASQELFTCCWLHRDDDALLAVAGQDSHIHILSVACSKEIRKLEGHTGGITDLQVSPRDDQHLLSASKDGTVRLWHVDSEKCLCVYNVKASVLCFSPTGSSFLTGGYNGDIREWAIPDMTNSSEPQYIDQGTLKISGKKMHAGCIGKEPPYLSAPRHVAKPTP